MKIADVETTSGQRRFVQGKYAEVVIVNYSAGYILRPLGKQYFVTKKAQNRHVAWYK